MRLPAARPLTGAERAHDPSAALQRRPSPPAPAPQAKAPQPAVALDGGMVRLWHRADPSFAVPKAALYLHLHLPGAGGRRGCVGGGAVAPPVLLRSWDRLPAAGAGGIRGTRPPCRPPSISAPPPQRATPAPRPQCWASSTAPCSTTT